MYIYYQIKRPVEPKLGPPSGCDIVHGIKFASDSEKCRATKSFVELCQEGMLFGIPLCRVGSNVKPRPAWKTLSGKKHEIVIPTQRWTSGRTSCSLVGRGGIPIKDSRWQITSFLQHSAYVSIFMSQMLFWPGLNREQNKRSGDSVPHTPHCFVPGFIPETDPTHYQTKHAALQRTKVL